MRNWRKWHARRQQRSACASRAACARWDTYHAAIAAEPVRADLPAVPLRVTIEQPGRMMRILELRRRDLAHRATWMFENGQCCGRGGKAKVFRLAERTTYL